MNLEAEGSGRAQEGQTARTAGVGRLYSREAVRSHRAEDYRVTAVRGLRPAQLLSDRHCSSRLQAVTRVRYVRPKVEEYYESHAQEGKMKYRPGAWQPRTRMEGNALHTHCAGVLDSRMAVCTP